MAIGRHAKIVQLCITDRVVGANGGKEWRTRVVCGNLQLLEASELGSEAALGGGVDDEDDLALVFGQRLLSARLC